MPKLEFLKTWQVLGPFQIGTREATWGADPLECYGGFSALKPDDRTFPSSLEACGQAHWRTIHSETPSGDVQHDQREADHDSCAGATLSIGYSHVEWSVNQTAYGWSALQWQAWIRGTLIVHGTELQAVKLSLPGILEFEIDGDRQFGGDFFSFDRAPYVRTLSPGAHILNVRIIRDVRAMGGVGEPVVNFAGIAQIIDPGLVVLAKEALLPDFIIDGGSAGSVCSIPVQNTGQDWLEVVNIQVENSIDRRETALVLDEANISIAPGQIRAINANLNIQTLESQSQMTFHVTYRPRGSSKVVKTKTHALQLQRRQASEPQKTVFTLPSGATTYALVKTPYLSKDDVANKADQIPVLIVLHGAGVEVESLQTREMLQTMGHIRAWVIVPTGGSTWSADDWHTWGLADIQAAVEAIPEYIVASEWKGPGVDTQSLYVVGHSNGGQGTWQVLTHIPDKIRGAAVVSGYSSIQNYIPYNFVREVDPRISSIIQGSLTSYRHELLVDNAKGIPIEQQHGSADDNVPVFHSRRMYQLLKENGSNPRYHEISNKGHWYTGIMATTPLKDFYRRIAEHKKVNANLPNQFSIVVPSTGEAIGSRGGMIVEQLRSLGQLGRVDVVRVSDDSWSIRTSNIQRLRLGHVGYSGVYPDSIKINGTALNIDTVSAHAPVWLYLDHESYWKVSGSSSWRSLAERSGPQFGTINAILRTKGDLHIQYHSDLTFDVALQTSRNLYQYYSASSRIVQDSEDIYAEGNIITIKQGVPAETLGNSWTLIDSANHSIGICHQGVKIQHSSGLEQTYSHCEGLGAIYLLPMTDERLRLVIWGYDKKGLQRAARLAPGLTGVGQPDFVILGPDCSWKGAGGVLAMGFFDHDWSISGSSYIS